MFFQTFFELYYLSFWGYFFILSGSCAIVFKKELKICKDENTLLYVYFFLPFVEFTVKVMMNKCNFLCVTRYCLLIIFFFKPSGFGIVRILAAFYNADPDQKPNTI